MTSKFFPQAVFWEPALQQMIMKITPIIVENLKNLKTSSVMKNTDLLQTIYNHS